MPLNKSNTRTFQRTLYAGILETVTLLKRDNDQRQGVVTKYTLYDCRRAMISKAGESIQGEMPTDETVVWHLSAIELDRIGVNYINVLDRIIDKYNRWWQPESYQMMTQKLFENHVCVQCVRIDPPNNNAKTGL